MQSLWQDLRYGARMLAKKPGFTLIVVLTLALGIGANATIFTWLKAVALNPVPGAADESRLMIFEGEGGASVSYPDYRDFRERATTLAGLACGDLQALSIGAKGDPERVTGMIVSGNYFDVLGVKMAYGRGFLPEEDQTPGAHQVVVIGHEIWRRPGDHRPNGYAQQYAVYRSRRRPAGIQRHDDRTGYRGMGSNDDVRTHQARSFARHVRAPRQSLAGRDRAHQNGSLARPGKG